MIKQIYKILLFCAIPSFILANNTDDKINQYLQNNQYKKAITTLEKTNTALGYKSKYLIGYIYNHRSDGKLNLKKALAWYKKAELEGSANASYKIAMFYLVGKVVKQDKLLAREYLLKAADKNQPKALYLIGAMTLKGDGFKRNPEKAYNYFHAAAKNGSRKALIHLGIISGEGLGVVQSDADAYQWFSLAYARKVKGSKKMMNIAFKRLNSIEKEFSKKLALKKYDIYVKPFANRNVQFD